MYLIYYFQMFSLILCMGELMGFATKREVWLILSSLGLALQRLRITIWLWEKRMGGATLGQEGSIDPQLFKKKKFKYGIFLWIKQIDIYSLVHMYTFCKCILSRMIGCSLLVSRGHWFNSYHSPSTVSCMFFFLFLRFATSFSLISAFRLSSLALLSSSDALSLSTLPTAHALSLSLSAVCLASLPTGRLLWPPGHH